MLLCSGVNFVPTFLIIGRIDSAMFEVNPPITKIIASGKRIHQGVHPPVEYQQVTKSHPGKVFYWSKYG